MPTTLNKPAGLPVFPPHDDPAGGCVLKTLLADQPWRSAIAWPEGFAGGIAHRLDNATSGALLVADSLAELEKYRAWFYDHKFVKSYRMLTAGAVRWDRNAIDKPIAHHPTKKSRMVVQRGHNTPHRGKWYPAHTEFRRLGGPLFEAKITTGIMHQIRVHAAFIGIPLAGDRLYGGGETPTDAPPGVAFFLHHLGLEGPDHFRTAKVASPAWAER
jgi:23S rRNA-/tRNA-specific pseudouridylate synthase